MRACTDPCRWSTEGRRKGWSLGAPHGKKYWLSGLRVKTWQNGKRAGLEKTHECGWRSCWDKWCLFPLPLTRTGQFPRSPCRKSACLFLELGGDNWLSLWFLLFPHSFLLDVLHSPGQQKGSIHEKYLVVSKSYLSLSELREWIFLGWFCSFIHLFNQSWTSITRKA